ncbi:MAG: glutamate--tRNA ligase [Candidatus Firestonebacteria bacterium]
MDENIRVRFAPSPTGYMHIGNARTALFNYLFAKRTGGTLILRIEDTDQERSTPEAVQVIVDSLKWLGIDWHEGYFGKDEHGSPVEKGKYGPYTQMKRLGIYDEYRNKLIAEGKAYYCFCTEDELEKKKQAATAAGIVPKYDRKCFKLSREEAESKKRNERFVVRFKVEPGIVEFNDLVRGKVSFNTDQIGDFVIARSDGVPVYNYAVVIDDNAMKISHVIRGEDHLSNTPRQILLYRALDFPLPKFAHLPMILGSDRSKLSKRHGETSLLAYRDKGFLPQAVFNYMSLLGWYPRDGVEIKNKEQLAKFFDLADVGKSGAVFDEKKLIWMNHEYMQQLDASAIYELCVPYIRTVDLSGRSPEWINKVLEAVKTGLNTCAEVPEQTKLFFMSAELTAEGLEVLKSGKAKEVLSCLVELFNKTEVTAENFKALLQEVAKKAEVKGKDLYMPVRLGLTGALHGPELAVLIPVLGSAECARRIEDTLKKL